MKTLLVLLSLASRVLSSEGELLYDTYCLECHSKNKLTLEKLKSDRDKFRAPPMNLVIERLKEVIKISVEDEDAKEAVVVAYIKDYIQKPSIDKGLCRVSCYTQFGEMPAISSNLSNEDLHTVASWSYENF